MVLIENVNMPIRDDGSSFFSASNFLDQLILEGSLGGAAWVMNAPVGSMFRPFRQRGGLLTRGASDISKQISILSTKQNYTASWLAGREAPIGLANNQGFMFGAGTFDKRYIHTYDRNKHLLATLKIARQKGKNITTLQNTFKSFRRIGIGSAAISMFAGMYELFTDFSSAGAAMRIPYASLRGNDSLQGNFDPGILNTRQAFTQRQRAIQIIHNSQLSMRAALGQEAQYLHG